MKPSVRINKIVSRIDKGSSLDKAYLATVVKAIIQYLDKEAARPKEYVPPPRFCK